jgi:cell division control protein 12
VDISSRQDANCIAVRLTVIDTPGFGDYVNNRDSWLPIIEFLDDQHESYMLQEQQPRRTDKIDLRVHACLYFIRPTGHTLKPLDIEVMKRLCSRVNLIPVVAKADTLSPSDLAKFKQRVRMTCCTPSFESIADRFPDSCCH